MDETLDSETVSAVIHRSLLPKLEEILSTIEGITTPQQRSLLSQIMDHIDDLGRRIVS